MLSASARLLRLLTVLSTRPEWTSAELADRLGIHERTIRRDIAKLRELDYGLESVSGRGAATGSARALGCHR